MDMTIYIIGYFGTLAFIYVCEHIYKKVTHK